MAATLLLDSTTWDLVLDANVNLAVAQPPYALAQDAASAIKLFAGEAFWDSTLGISYLTQIFGVAPPPLAQIKQDFINAALTVPGVVSAQVFITSLTNRMLSGQVQVIGASSSTPQAADFTVINPQGAG